MKDIDDVIDELVVKKTQLDLLSKHNRDMLYEIGNLKTVINDQKQTIGSLTYHIELFKEVKELLENNPDTKALTFQLREIRREKNKWKKDFQDTLSKLIYANQEIEQLKSESSGSVNIVHFK